MDIRDGKVWWRDHMIERAHVRGGLEGGRGALQHFGGEHGRRRVAAGAAGDLRVGRRIDGLVCWIEDWQEDATLNKADRRN